MDSEPIMTRAGGKVLLAGGYGVLEENNYGLALGVANSFYCTCIKSDPSLHGSSIRVSSFQLGQHWEYHYKEGNLVEVDNKSNAFVQCSIASTLKFYNRVGSAGTIHLELAFSRNFISDKDALDETGFPVYQQGYSKTGLGSSACVVVSIVSCLVLLLDNTLKQQQKKGGHFFHRLVNLLSQVSNLEAQKKIGSNFDISTAVFGSHLYRNILPHRILPLLGHWSREQVQQLLEVDPQIQSLNCPSPAVLGYIVDVNMGADTRSMVKSFMAQLKKCDQEVQSQFFKASKEITLELFAIFQGGDFKECRQVNQRHRQLQRKYSLITGVPIEPEQLSPTIDAILTIPGVAYAICPGSGGFDAIFVLALQDVHSQLNQAVKGHKVRPIQLLFGQTDNRQVSQQEKQQVLSSLGWPDKTKAG